MPIRKHIRILAANSGPIKRRALYGLRILVHPFALLIGMIGTSILWIPFGQRYHGWLWTNTLTRITLYALAFGYAACALAGCIFSLSQKTSSVRVVISIGALLVGLLGIAAILQWSTVYVTPMLDIGTLSALNSKYTAEQAIERVAKYYHEQDKYYQERDLDKGPVHISAVYGRADEFRFSQWVYFVERNEKEPSWFVIYTHPGEEEPMNIYRLRENGEVYPLLHLVS
jgi:cation transport ATPase